MTLNSPPQAWWWFAGSTQEELGNFIDNNPVPVRIIDLDTYIAADGKRRFASVLVKNTGEAWWWWPGLTFNELVDQLEETKGRITSLKRYIVDGVEKFATAIVKDSQAWWWFAGSTQEELGNFIDNNPVPVRIIDLDTYIAADGKRRFASVLVKNTGEAWWWWPGLTFNELGEQLEETKGRIAALKKYSAEGIIRFAVVLIKDPGQVWYWYSNIDFESLSKKFDEKCSYLIKLQSFPAGTSRKFEAVMLQYPQTSSPNTANLLELTGSAILVDVMPNSEVNYSLKMNLKNLINDKVTIEHASWFFVNPGGWSDGGYNLISKHGDFFGLSPTINNLANHTIPWSGHSGSISHFALQLQVKGPNGKTQDLLTSFPVTRSGFASPSNLSIEAPLFLALQEPVEIIPLTNGKKWITIIGEVVNGTGKPQTVSSLHIRLSKEGVGVPIFDQDIPVEFWIEPGKNDPMIQSTTPTPKFIKGFDVPNDFSKGVLKIDVDTKIDGRCYKLTRTVHVISAPSVSLQAPVTGIWTWNNGPGVTSLHLHSYPLSRYVYDMAILDSNGSSYENLPPGYSGDNENYYCFNEPILCMADGHVIEVPDSIPDNNGDLKDHFDEDNSRIVVESKNIPGTYQIYAHVRKDSTEVTEGQEVVKGQVLAKVGNAGQSSGPHLHVGYYTLDHSGRYRNIPMSFTNFTSKDGLKVNGVPISFTEYKTIS